MKLFEMAAQKLFGRGKSKSAERRREKFQRDHATVHARHVSGEVIHMSRNREYVVAKDGSYRRITSTTRQKAIGAGAMA